MVKARPARCYRTVKRPYTRKSRYRELSYVKGIPGLKIVKFEIGNTKGSFSHSAHLISSRRIQVRHTSLESARLAANRYMNKFAGKDNFHLIIRVYPHHVLRENRIMTGAGADRFSSGMKKSFGKPVGTAAQVKEGQEIATIKVKEEHIKFAMAALKKANFKLPMPCHVKVVHN